ncbi:hypothetical protein [Magnetospirillum sp. 15-1]|uniref:hypothetical protein n=1 Tax=Magnetospirillum sp. 15-1 TaxID=1979370 RepID=UPI000BBC0BF9|nr:hypothetical protein [Magnetospirillum sp. 15-1]
MPKTNVYDDEEVREFVDQLHRLATYSEMAEVCLEKFGPDRAWSRSKIVRYWQTERPAHKGYRNRIDGNKELRNFIDERLGRLTLDELATECVKEFGAKNSPSRSSIHRYWDRVRRRRK